MLRYAILLLAGILPITPNGKPAMYSRPFDADQRLLGRWDISVTTPGGEKPSWLEIEHSGRDILVGRFVGIVGSARPISIVAANGDSLSFSIPHQWEDGSGDLTVRGKLRGNGLAGVMTFPDGKSFPWTAVRAPRLDRSTPVWGAPIRLLHVNDLGGWHASGSTNQWIVTNGALSSPRSGTNLITDRTFGDFKLHVEFRYPKESNSGVYLRGDEANLNAKTDSYVVFNVSSTYRFSDTLESQRIEPWSIRTSDTSNTRNKSRNAVT